jgi:ribulose-phosphate 3-epimerase
MAYNPIQYLPIIKKSNIHKVLIHYEVFKTNQELLDTKTKFKAEGIKVFLVLKPETTIKILKPLLTEFDGVMLMSVEPGAQGQQFIEETYDKCHELKGKIPLQCDGGINNTNLEYLFLAGCDIAAVGSYISSCDNAKKNFLILDGITKKVNY